RRVELIFATASDPALFQPFHEALGLSWEDAQIAVKKAEAEIASLAAKSLRELIQDARADGLTGRGTGIVGAPERNLDSIGSPHIRAHAAEGVLFRRILESGAAAVGIESRSFNERELEAIAMRELDLSEAKLKRSLDGFGKTLGRPWRADEKAAA